MYMHQNKSFKKNKTYINNKYNTLRGRRDRMVVGFTTSYVISGYHH